MTGQSLRLTAEEEHMRGLASTTRTEEQAKKRVEAGKQTTGMDI